MELVNVTIDDKKINVSAGTNVLAAARSVGIYIPSLCSHPDLPPAALEKPNKVVFQKNKKIENTLVNKSATKCGLCLVEIKGIKELVSSCVTQVKKDMLVITNNKKILEERKKNLIPIMSRHPHSCLTCSQQEGCSQTQCSSNVPEKERCCSNFGNCELKNVAKFIGIPENTPKWFPSNFPIVENQPLFNVNYNLCIGCIRCVRACDKLRGVGAIGFVWDNDGLLQVGNTSQTLSESYCKFCTACVEVCPTGALQDKHVKIINKEKDAVPCKTACPVHIDVPWYLRMISKNNIDAAYKIIREKVPIPSILGRICIRPCEDKCRRKELNDAISICALKRFASNSKLKSNSWEIDNKYSTNKKVAVIGAGPTGLTAAFYLCKKGHNVTLYDEKDKAGGMLRYGIPRYRLPMDILDHEIKNILSIGIKFVPNSKLGANFNLESLKKFNAILIAVGAQKDRKLNIEGSNLDGVLGGILFLRNVSENKNTDIGKNIIVIGGGNVAVDVAMTALRCGAKKVSIVCLEPENEMPASNWEINAVKSEGIKIMPSLAPKKILGKEGRVVGIEVIKCICVFNSNGIFDPQYDEQINKQLIADQIIVAIGQETDIPFIDSTNISTKKGLITVNEDSLETTQQNIYAGGDVVSMPGSVITAIASGRKVAKSIDVALGGTGIIDEILFKRNKLNDYIGKNKGFSKLSRKIEKEKSIKTRCNNFEEIVLGLNKKEATEEATRCLQCDLRLKINCNPSPPQETLTLNISNINSAIPNEIEGVYKLFDKDHNVISIVGTKSLRKNLTNAKENNEMAKFFEFEKDKMYSKRESELIQKHLQKHGSMPGGDEDMDDLF